MQTVNSTKQPQKTIQNHSLSLDNAQKAIITGVTEVVSATNSAVLIKLTNTNMQIAGENLRVEKLSPEEKLVVLVGNVYDIKYTGQGTKTGFFKKLFR